MEYLLSKFDKFLCSYLGLGNESDSIHCNSVATKKGNVFINSSSSNGYISTDIELNNFFKSNDSKIENIDQLGFAIGKLIADDLIILFDGNSINQEN